MSSLLIFESSQGDRPFTVLAPSEDTSDTVSHLHSVAAAKWESSGGKKRKNTDDERFMWYMEQPESVLDDDNGERTGSPSH